MTKEEIIKLIDQAFSDVEKPDHFTNYGHCNECFEIDRYFIERSEDPFRDGDPGDRICFLLSHAFKYLMPHFIRYGFSYTDSAFFDELVTFYLGVSLLKEGEDRLSEFSYKQLTATYKFVEYSLSNHREQFLRDGLTIKEINQIVEWWENHLKVKKQNAEPNN